MIVGLFAPLAVAQEPSILEVRVIEGDGAAYPIGSRATRGITVQVIDEVGRAVDGATVTFQLPQNGGPGGTFSTGAKIEIATTGNDGRTGVWGMQWNRTVGAFDIRITAVKAQTRAGTLCSQYLTDAMSPHDSLSSKARAGPSHSHKLLWISLVVAGAAAGAAVIALSAKPPQSATASSSGVQLGTPTIILGHP